MAKVSVQAEDFDIAAEFAALQQAAPGCGGIGSFIGVVRSTAERPIIAMTLEHYPAMTMTEIAGIAAAAESRFSLLACTVIHRFGRLRPGERIVFVGAAAAHRRAALDATSFLIDWLKTKAPFWKQEHFADGTTEWVGAKAEDDADAARWS
jgi:molybdopterin synthase catalytic subunit